MPSGQDQESEAKFGATTSRVTLTIVAISTALLFFIIFAGLSMNRSGRQAQEALIDAALTDLVNQTLMEQKAWAFWDDSARATRQRHLPRTWFDQQVSAALTEGYRHDSIYLLGPDNRILYGYGHGKRLPPDGLLNLWPAMQPMLREIRTGAPRAYRRRDEAFGLAQQRYDTLWSARSGRWAANILKDGDRAVILSIMTVVPTIDRTAASARPHLLVSIALLDQARLDLIGGKLHIEDLRLVAGGVKSGDTHPLVTDDGKLAGAIAWKIDQPGQVMLTRILPIFAILLLIALLYARLVLARLKQTHALLQAQESNARFLAMHDGLSQLPNRRHFMATLSQRLDALAGAAPSRRLCVAYIDVDRFKDINDVVGHGAGDALVAQIGPRLRQLLGPDDLLARLGGDEFAILHETPHNDGPRRLGAAILSAFKQPFEIDGSRIEVTASAGIAVADPGETDPERILRDADISLYQAKDRGRNRYVLFEPTMAELVRIRHETEVDLRAAIGTSQIVVHYQPVISTRTGKVTSFEALVRWQHPAQGLLQPSSFVAVAEQSGLMVPLGDHILEKVFREASVFAGLDVAVNLSPVQLRQRGLPDRIVQLARRFAIDPQQIILEVTETMLLDADEVISEALARLRQLGFRMALDDFGTGYSSLSYLSRYDFDKIKIDRSFVSSGSLEKMRPILEGIVHIGRGLHMKIVAEGVETAAELAMVQALGCSGAQGYYISPPLPLHAIPAFLANPPEIVVPAPLIQLARG